MSVVGGFFAGFRDGVPLNAGFFTEVWEDEEPSVLQRRREQMEDAAWHIEQTRRQGLWVRAERKKEKRRRHRKRGARSD